MILISTDWHLDDQSQNDYRWNDYRWRAFDHVHELLDSYGDRITSVMNCGDILDKRDRYSGIFVNRFLDGVRSVGARKPFTILQGNHDRTIDGKAFFSFVNYMACTQDDATLYSFLRGADPIKGVRYVTEPTPDGKIILLPFTPTPVETWAGIDFSKYKAAFMHVTPNGAIGENGCELAGNRLPKFPGSLKIFTGDVHVPQRIGQFTVIGCPHPVRFGDKFQPRMLLLDEDTFEIVEEIPIATVSKRVIQVSSIEELRAIRVEKGDQVRLRFDLDTASVDIWGEIEAGVAAWAKAAGVTVAGTEVDVRSSSVGDSHPVDADIAPDALLREFGVSEGVSDDLLKVGLELLTED